MVVWMALIALWSIGLMSLAGAFNRYNAVTFFVFVLCIDVVVFLIWSSNYALQYFQVWPYIPQ